MARAPKAFPGFERCIYCGRTGSLRDEHIIPHSLGGDTVIAKASCPDCEKITSYLDGYLARDTFNECRSHVGLRSRRPKGRPKTLIASSLRPDGTEVDREFSIKDQSYVLMMPIWSLPGITQGKGPTLDFDVTQGHAYIFTSPEVQQWIDQEQLKIGAWPYINYPTFARAIARISYCHAVTCL